MSFYQPHPEFTDMPTLDTFDAQLRFYVLTSRKDDPALPFIVSLWSFCISREGLTPKQSKAFEPYFHTRAAEHVRHHVEMSS